MKTQALLRKIHHWGSLCIMLQMGLVICAGLLLILKKEIDWVQPPTAKGVARTDVPIKTMDELFLAAQNVEELELRDWSELSRVDFKPDKGVVKFVAPNNWKRRSIQPPAKCYRSPIAAPTLLNRFMMALSSRTG